MSRRRNVPPAHGRNGRRRRRERKALYLVVGGGEVTEKQYFEYYKTEQDNINLKYEPQVGSPRQLAVHAVKRKRETDANSSVDSYKGIWVVVDVDDFHDHADAQRICRDNGIGLIISSPCFEVWLIDYVQRCPDSIVLTKDAERRAAKLGITEGARNKYINLDRIAGLEETAIKNARSHNTSERLRGRRLLVSGKEREYAPWTDMVDVMETLQTAFATVPDTATDTTGRTTAHTEGNAR